MCEGRIKGRTADWMTPGVFTGDSQHIIFLGLTPGTVYTVQVRSLGGVPGQSDWSNQASTRRCGQLALQVPAFSETLSIENREPLSPFLVVGY